MTRLRDLIERYRKLVRYSAVSIISVATGEATLVVLFFFGHMSAQPANVGACVAGGIPSYVLNRRWVWGKSGRSTFWREHLPFWVLTFVGLALSTWFAGFAGSYGKDHFDSRAIQTGLVALASLAAFGTIWVGKYMAFNQFMFGAQPTQHRK